jgi:hypothetical protein
MKRPDRVQVQLAILVFILMVLSTDSNLYIIEHQTTYHQSSNLAADFSALYNAAWAFFNNPDHLYVPANFPVPYGQNFPYPPYFVVFVIPLLAFSFPTAEFIFSAAQFALLPLMALLVYLIFKPKSGIEYALVASVVEMVLLEPFDSRKGLAIWPQLQQYLPLLVVLPIIPYVAYEAFSLKSRKTSVLCFAILGVLLLWLDAGPAYGAPNFLISTYPYGTQWLLGQTKVLELALILLSLWLAGRRPMLSAPVLLFSAFDPRFTLLALPMYLYIMIKNKSLRKMLKGAALAVLVLVVPFILYHGAYEQYVSYVFSDYFAPTGYLRYFKFYLFDYDWLLFYGLVSVEIGFALIEILRSGKIARLRPSA